MMSEDTVETLKELVLALLAERDKAISEFKEQTEKRFEAGNEIKQAMANQANTFLTRTEAEVRMNRTDQDVRAVTDRLNKGEGRGDGLKDGWLAMIAIIMAVAAILGLFFKK
jgi:hypothetical protein